MSGKITEFGVPTSDSRPESLVVVRNAVWFTERHGNKIAHFTIGIGGFKEYDLPMAGSRPFGIALGPVADSVRVTERVGNAIGILPLYPIGD